MEKLSDKISVMREMAFSSNENVQDTLNYIYELFDENEEILKKCFEEDCQITECKEKLIINRMLSEIQEVKEYKFKDTKVYDNIEERKIIEIRQNYGVIGVFYDGNIYVTIDLICKALKTCNAMILNIGGKNNIVTNNFIVKLVKEALKRNHKPEMLVEINFTDDITEAIDEEFDKIILIETNNQFNSHANRRDILISGYGHYEIYVSDLTNEDFIKEILSKEESDIKLFIKEGLDTNLSGILVKDIAEAIDKINKEGARYSSAIFTQDSDEARCFVKRVLSKYAFVNASPTISRNLDISIEDLYYKKVGMV